MSIDYQSVQNQIRQLGKNAPARIKEFEKSRNLAINQLNDHSRSLRALQEKIGKALTKNPYLRSALPVNEPLNGHFPLPKIKESAAIIAADGSQIFPDRHNSLEYSLVNVGAIQLVKGSEAVPIQTIESNLLYDDQLYTENGRITERLVALMRDLGEREMLAKLAEALPKPIITLTDGPLELWDAGEGSQNNRVFESTFEKYLNAMRRLYEIGASTAGYIDKPAGDLVVRMLEIASLPNTSLDQAGKTRPYQGLTDISILEDIIGPDERSAIFGIQSVTSSKYQDELALHFFFLNVGSRESGRPYLVRVEIPAWVTTDPVMVDQLHATLISQCRALGTRPYPYLLHRSHEVALVSIDEKIQIENMIALELRNHGIEIKPASYKSTAKQSGGRQRYR